MDFLTRSQNWNGASATIVKEDGSSVWGALWEIDISNLDDLDRLVLLQCMELTISYLDSVQTGGC